MIDKIIKIKGVGRFQNYQVGGGDMALKKATIIYAENGHGKTTLSNIIRSLSTGNDSLITNRLSVGLNEQEIKINVGGAVRTFKDGKWQAGSLVNRIEVFDSFFINENVYSGFDFSFEHSKNLHRFVLGEEGVRISKSIEDIKNEVAEQNKALAALEASIQTQLGKEPVKAFLVLKPEEDVDSKVSDAKRALDIAKKAKEISEKPLLSHLQITDIDDFLLKIKQTIDICLETISGNYIKSFETHKMRLEGNGLVNAEDWLYDGFRATQADELGDKTCLFCKQPIDDSIEIIKAYSQYFNDEYGELQRSLESQAKWLDGANYDILTKKSELAYATNAGLCEYWASHTLVTEPRTRIDFRNSQGAEKLQAVKRTVNSKLLNLLEKQDSTSIDDLRKLLSDVNSEVISYNSEVDELNRLIQNVKSYDVSVTTASGRLTYLLLVQKRFGDLKSACDDHEVMCEAIKENNKEKDKLQKHLKTYSKGFMIKYGEHINAYLKIFFPEGHYQLSSIDSSYSGSSKDPSAEYTLNLWGKPISFSNKIGLPQGKYTLSEGDKSSIAFAFFLAKLASEDISNKIIVFDDPVTSLDQNRRRRTIDEIVSILARAKQVLILSHSTTFVYDVYEKCSESKVMKIAYGGIIEDYATIVDDMQSEYIKKLRILEAFLAVPSERRISETRGAIRIVLEDNLKFRFRSFLYKSYDTSSGSKVGPFTNKAGLGKMVEILEASPCNFRTTKADVLAELRRLNELSNPDHHGSMDKEHRTEQISVGELLGYVKDTLKMIEEKL